MEPECAFPFLETHTLFPATAVEEGSFLSRSLPAKDSFRKQLQGDLTLQVLRTPPQSHLFKNNLIFKDPWYLVPLLFPENSCRVSNWHPKWSVSLMGSDCPPLSFSPEM